MKTMLAVTFLVVAAATAAKADQAAAADQSYKEEVARERR